MRRFFVEPSAIGETHIAIREPSDRNHIKNVLRMGVGDEAMLSDGTAFEYHARISEILPDNILFEILDKQGFGSEPSVRITLFQAIPKQGKMEVMIQKSVELGVHTIAPVYTARSVPKGNIDNAIVKRDRWQRVAAEAGKQCRRGIIPMVETPIPMGEAVVKLAGYDLSIFPYENEEDVTIRAVLAPVAAEWKSRGPAPAGEGARIAVFIGPEGGISDEEAAALIHAGAKPCSLGRRILRTETAGPATIAMLMYEWEL
ncbi:MAG: 16S rRNA (uracil(1498)-N(3))-methyltransferase [Clostridiales Family XIII bacterium]|jgi:16S rRNA (uracil1498-N3)-methyltransferase|nr:16S rRNA (uracil(1498)-N(3))-methyltransferase [Clostridiales Family XIII bacterium]